MAAHPYAKEYNQYIVPIILYRVGINQKGGKVGKMVATPSGDDWQGLKPSRVLWRVRHATDPLDGFPGRALLQNIFSRLASLFRNRSTY